MELKIERIRQKVEETILNEVAQYIFSQSQENIIRNRTSDTGWLLKSGEILPKDGEIIVRYTAPYSCDIEYGTDPHPVNPYNLVGWVRRKLGIRPEKATPVAFAISKKIEREGTDPQPFLRSAVNSAIVHFKRKKIILKK